MANKNRNKVARKAMRFILCECDDRVHGYSYRHFGSTAVADANEIKKDIFVIHTLL
jgi:hypothetical protein